VVEESRLLWQFTTQAWLPLAGFFLTLALGVFVWSRKWDSLLHQTFAVLNVAAALWNLDVFLLFTLQNGDLAAALDRMFQIPIATIPFLGLFFTFVFLGKKPSHSMILTFGTWTAFLWVLSGSADYISGWNEYWFGYYGRAGRLYFLFPATHLACLAISSLYLWRERRNCRDHLRRHQIAYLLIANLLLGVISLDNFGPLYGAQRLPLGNMASLLYFAVMAVTIVRYRLLDVQVLFRYGLLYSSLTFVLSGIYFVLILGLQDLFRLEVFNGSRFLPILPALAVAFAFGPVRNSLQERLDRRFFRSHAAMRDSLARFSARVHRLACEKDVWDAAWEAGWSLIDPERAVVIARKDSRFAAVLVVGDIPGGAEAQVRRFVELGPQGSRRRQEVTAEVEQGAFELRITVLGEAGLIGGCLLGPKRGGGIYSAEDVDFLRGIAGQSALTVEKLRFQEESREREKLATLGKAAAVVSHELRNPFNVIRGAMALLRSRIAGGDGASLLSVVEEEVRKGDLFIRDFLAACREPVSRLRRLDLASFLKEFEAHWPRESFPGLELHLDLPGEAFPVEADTFQLSRVFQNLVRNAAEASGGEGRVSVRCRRQGDRGVMVILSDDGPGIEEKHLQCLFEPFYTTKRTGTGLGLSIVRGIIEAHRGRISAESGTGGGAVFRIWLPSSST
jgi:signal transduction histidine kinase